MANKGQTVSMRVSQDEAVRLLREWWPDRTMSREDMAAELGVTGQYVYVLARRAGLPHRVKAKHHKRMTVRIRGITYPTVEAAAEALGVSISTVHTGLKRGRPDYIGTGVARPDRAYAGNREKGIQVGPVRWPSQAACARDLGLSDATISRMRSEGRTDRLMALVMKRQAQMEAAP